MNRWKRYQKPYADKRIIEVEVSRIREDGQVFFKGEGGAPARYLTKVTAPD